MNSEATDAYVTVSFVLGGGCVKTMIAHNITIIERRRPTETDWIAVAMVVLIVEACSSPLFGINWTRATTGLEMHAQYSFEISCGGKRSVVGYFRDAE